MAYDLAIAGGRVVTADDTQRATLAIDDGTIAAILAPTADVAAERVVDATGLHVLPGGVDPHVHMMDPGDTHRETFETGTAAAAAGGITTVGEHHRTDPTVLTPEILTEKRSHLAEKARVDYGLLAGGHPDNVDQLEGLWAEGAIAFKSFTCNVHGVPALQSADMHQLFAEVERIGGISMIHPEDELLVTANADRLQSEGITDGRALPAWRSKAAEQVAVATTLQLAELTDVRCWLAHLSHPTVVDQVTAARERGVEVYAETCPQYLYLTETDVIDGFPHVSFTPPARSAADRDGLWDRLAAGEIDMVNADHAPTTWDEKVEGDGNVFDLPFGIPGVETVLPLLLDGVNEGKASLERIVEVFATNPARILGVYPRKGAIRVGSDADFVLVDLDHKWTIRTDDIVAKCGWTPYNGLEVVGKPVATYVRGEAVYDDHDIVGEPGHGTFIQPGATSL